LENLSLNLAKNLKTFMSFEIKMSMFAIDV